MLNSKKIRFRPLHRLVRSSKVRQFKITVKQWRRLSGNWVAAILIGIVAVIFGQGSHLIHSLFFFVYDYSPYWMLLITPLGLGLSVALMRKFFLGAAGGGISQSIATLSPYSHALRQRFLSIRAIIGKMLLTLLGIGSGGTFGYEGPIVQVGAAIKYSLAPKSIQQQERTTRGLILAGGAAGVAAAFNAPIAGIVFAIEEMGKSFDHHSSSTILISVILAGITSMFFLGNYSYFGSTDIELNLQKGSLAILTCGVFCGIMGGITAKIFSRVSVILPKPVFRFKMNSPIMFAMICGLILAIIGIQSGGMTFGTGYWQARDIIEGHGDGLESYGILKFISMILSYLSGAPGGTFAPSLAVGAGFGLNISSYFQEIPATAVILLGMVSFFAGMTRAPITGFVIVMEMTNSSTMVIPLMASAVIAAGISRLIHRRPMYEEQAHMILKEEALRQSKLKNTP